MLITRRFQVWLALDTPEGKVFHGDVRSVIIRAGKTALIEVGGAAGNYASLTDNVEITMQTLEGAPMRYNLTNALARFKKGELFILAEAAARVR